MENLSCINESNKNYKTKPTEDLTLLSNEDLINILSNYRENKRRFVLKYQQEKLNSNPDYKKREISPNNKPGRKPLDITKMSREELLKAVEKIRNNSRTGNNKYYHEVVKTDDELYTNFLNKCKKTTNTYYHKTKALSVSNNSISCF
jgi:hypothetical protein